MTVTAPLGAAGGQFAVSAFCFCFCFSRLLPSELSSMRDAGSLEIASAVSRRWECKQQQLVVGAGGAEAVTKAAGRAEARAGNVL